MTHIKALLYYIIELIMALFVLLLMALLIFKYTIYNNEYIKDVFEKHNYSENISKDIKNDMKNNIIPTQLPESVLDNIYTEDELKETINSLIDKVYTNKLSDNLRNNIDKYIKDNNINVDNNESVNKIVVQMTDIYKSKITQSNIFNKVQKIISKTSKYIDLVIIISIVSLLLLFIISLFLKREYNISLNLLIASFMDIIITIFIKSNININKIKIWDDTVSDILHDIINNMFKISSITVLIFIIVSILLILITKDKKSKKVSSKK